MERAGEDSRQAFLRVCHDDPMRLEIAAAEAWEAGAAGVVEEPAATAGVPESAAEPGSEFVAGSLVIYAPLAVMPAIRHALARVLGEDAVPAAPELVEPDDWASAWKRAVEPVEVSPRLRIRPSFHPASEQPGRVELVIDPGQAFGTGGHASTTLALRWVDERSAAIEGARVLDVGTGTGVLAIAALRFGAASAVGFDLDPLAAPEARLWAQRNSVSDLLSLFTGPLDALGGPPFDWIFANLLRREMLPLVEGIVERLATPGWLVLSGLLSSEQAEVEAAFGAHGLRCDEARIHCDEGGDEWLSLLLRKG